MCNQTGQLCEFPFWHKPLFQWPSGTSIYLIIVDNPQPLNARRTPFVAPTVLAFSSAAVLTTTMDTSVSERSDKPKTLSFLSLRVVLVLLHVLYFDFLDQ